MCRPIGFQFMEVKTMKLEVGKFYRSREGKKVEVVSETCEGDFRVTHPHFLTHKPSGECYGMRHRDIVAIWENPVPRGPVPSGTPAGTKIRCINSLDGQFTKGEIYTLRDTSTEWRCPIVTDDAGEENGWGARNFELVEETNVDQRRKRAQELVDLLNKRDEYLKEAVVNGEIEVDTKLFSSGFEVLTPAHVENVGWKYRLKPKVPKFPEPIALRDSGHHVELRETGLKVGCQEFNSDKLKRALQFHCTNNGAGEEASNSLGIKASRKGITYQNRHHLTWADADQLLAFLEQVKS